LDSTHNDRSFASVAIFASLVLHGLLAWFILQHVVDVVPPPHFISVMLVRPAPPPPPKPAVPPKPVTIAPVPVPKPVTHTAPPLVTKPIPHPSAQEHSLVKRQTAERTKAGPPVMHFGAAGDEAGLGMDLGTPNSGTANGQGSLGDFDDAVKQRIEAAKTYPPGIPYMWNECVVEYQVTVDPSGNLLSYKLYGCDDPFLDSAARAAILMASPFPTPPNFGGSHYTVFGSLVFKHH
jgi:outer membrane biosynthesis protein TonB